MATDKASTKRARASTPRSRGGCVLCRQRRVKCGEERPACERCKKSGWECPGYKQERPTRLGTADTGHGDGGRPTNTQQTSLVEADDITQYALPFRVPGGREERRALHYYSTLAVDALTGLHSTDFWSKTILQRCQHEAPIRHATAALGQLHVEYISTPKTADFAPSCRVVEVYGKAIRSLRNYLAPVKLLIAPWYLCARLYFAASSSYDLSRPLR